MYRVVQTVLLTFCVNFAISGLAHAQCDDPCRPHSGGRLPENTNIHFAAGNGMENYFGMFMNVADEWNIELSTQGSSNWLDEGTGGWIVSLDDTLPGTTAAETDHSTKTIKINSNKVNQFWAIALHEIGHVLLLTDVSASYCAGETAMYWTLEGNPGYVTSADDCTLWHVYSIRDESPIILTLTGGYPRLTGPEVYFDLSNCGAPQLLGWTQPDAREGFLVLDRNGDGAITSGAEMFGNYTPFPGITEYVANDGFQALAAFDDPANGGDNDGWITTRDVIFSTLRLWIDENHNGTSEPDELKTLAELGVEAISVAPRESPKRDRYGNLMRLVAPFLLRTRDGELIRLLAVDAYLVHQ